MGEKVYCFNNLKILVQEYQSITYAAKMFGCNITILNNELMAYPKRLYKNHYWSYTNDNNFETITYKNTGKSKTVYQYSLDGKYIQKFSSMGEAARYLGIKKSNHIGECCRGLIKSYKGYIWKYCNDIV